jgi:putative endonuclease
MWWYVYIMTNKKNGTLYIWITNNLMRRVIEHKSKTNLWFSYKYGLKTLVYYEEHISILNAIQREKQLKNRHRERKINLIESLNKDWKDLSYNI